MLPQNREIAAVAESAAESGMPYQSAVRSFRKAFLKRKLNLNNGNQCKTARQAGLHRNTITRQMRELGISRSTPRKSVQAETNFYAEQAG